MSGGLLALLVCVGQLMTAQAVPLRPSAAGLASDYTFSTSTGLLVFHVRPDRVGDFEQVMFRLAAGLSATTDPVRRQQRDGWRLMRSNEPQSGGAVYVVVIDPVVAGADYDPARLLTELWPSEANLLFERLRGAVLKVERLALGAVRQD